MTREEALAQAQASANRDRVPYGVYGYTGPYRPADVIPSGTRYVAAPISAPPTASMWLLDSTVLPV